MLTASKDAPASELETAKMKLVTVIAPYGVGDRLTKDLQALGVHGYTKSRADGWGRHGAREYGLTDGANVRLDLLVSLDVANSILERIVSNFGDDAVVAFMGDVEAVPRRHFE